MADVKMTEQVWNAFTDKIGSTFVKQANMGNIIQMAIEDGAIPSGSSGGLNINIINTFSQGTTSNITDTRTYESGVYYVFVGDWAANDSIYTDVSQIGNAFILVDGDTANPAAILLPNAMYQHVFVIYTTALYVQQTVSGSAYGELYNGKILKFYNT